MPRFTDALARLWPRRTDEIVSVKASATGPLIAFETLGRPVWTPRDYQAFAREGFMQNAIVYRSVRMIAEAAASIPVLLYERGQEIEEHPLLDLIAHPSPDYTSADFFEAWYGFLLVAGNAYVEAVAAGGRLRELHVLRPDRMKVVPGPEGWPEAYEYTAGGSTVRFDEEPVASVRPILHVRLFHPANDHYGMSPIEAAAAAIDLHNTAARWNKALLDNSARPSGALVYGGGDGRMTAEQFGRLKTELEQGFQGAKQAGRPLLLEGGLDWKPLGLSPKDMDFVEARHGAAREIALALGVPPMLLGIPGDNTYSNYQEATRSFWRQTVLPLVTRTMKALSGWLAPGFGGGFEFRPDLDQVEALSIEREALWARIDRVGFLTVNEKRAAAGYGAVDGGDALLPALSRVAPTITLKSNFDPNQPRAPVGRSDGGQWVDAGGGSGSAGPGRVDRGGLPDPRSDPSGAHEVERVQNTRTPEAQFGPSKHGWHNYSVSNRVCAAELRCSKEEMADQLARFSVPGQDPAEPAQNNHRYFVSDPRSGLPAGYVETFVSADGLKIVNRTQPLHLLYDGRIERIATQAPDGSWYVTTHGIGNNVIPGMNVENEREGPKIFDFLDQRLRENIERHHGIDKSHPKSMAGRFRGGRDDNDIYGATHGR